MSVLVGNVPTFIGLRRVLGGFAAILFLILSACSTTPPKTLKDHTTANPIFVPHELSGRLVARYQENGKLNHQAARFTLNRSTPEDSRLQFIGPFGVILLSLEITPQKTTLSQIGKPTLTAATLNELLARYLVKPLPVPLPIPDFYDWLIGMGTTKNASVFVVPRDRDQTYDVVTQGAWQLHYGGWGTLPARLTITHEVRQDLELKVTVEDYQEL